MSELVGHSVTVSVNQSVNELFTESVNQSVSQSLSELHIILLILVYFSLRRVRLGLVHQPCMEWWQKYRKKPSLMTLLWNSSTKCTKCNDVCYVT